MVMLIFLCCNMVFHFNWDDSGFLAVVMEFSKAIDVAGCMVGEGYRPSGVPQCNFILC